MCSNDTWRGCKHLHSWPVRLLIPALAASLCSTSQLTRSTSLSILSRLLSRLQFFCSWLARSASKIDTREVRQELVTSKVLIEVDCFSSWLLLALKTSDRLQVVRSIKKISHWVCLVQFHNPSSHLKKRQWSYNHHTGLYCIDQGLH